LKDYGFISVFSNDGLLLWSGDINKKALKDIFQYQLNLSHLGLKRRLPYTDILLVPIVDRSNFNKFEKEFRNLQENHASSKIISGNSNELG
jgi:hypothetical protein